MRQLGCVGSENRASEVKEGHLELRRGRGKGNAPEGRNRGGRRSGCALVLPER